MSRIAGLMVAALTVVGATDAAAYVRTKAATGAPTAWQTPSLDLVIKPVPTTFEVDGPTFLGAATLAAAPWSWPAISCTRVELRVNAGDASIHAARDSQNAIMVHDGLWCVDGDVLKGCYEPEALAVTTVFVRSTGEIVEADIEINGVDFRWGALPEGQDASVPGDTHDVANALTHELGHLLGLNHPCRSPGDPADVDQHANPIPLCSGASNEIVEATLFPSSVAGETIRRSLTADEMVAMCDIYPRSAGTDAGAVDAATSFDGAGDAPAMDADPRDVRGEDARGDVGSQSDSGCGCGVGAMNVGIGSRRGLAFGLILVAVSRRRQQGSRRRAR